MNEELDDIFLNDDDEITEEEFFNYLTSNKFKEDFAKQVEKDTWDKGFPMVYMDKQGNIVEHWKDGTINILKTKEELDEKERQRRDI